MPVAAGPAALVEDGHNGLADALEAARGAHPIPDYQAPPPASDAPVPAAARIGAVFHSVVFAGWSKEQLRAMPDERVDSELHTELIDAQQKFAPPESVLPPPRCTASSGGGASCTG